jgi:hypothetical protein
MLDAIFVAESKITRNGVPRRAQRRLDRRRRRQAFKASMSG